GKCVEDTGIDDDHRSAASEAVPEHIVDPLGHVGAPAVPNADERRQRASLGRKHVELSGELEQLGRLLVRQPSDELDELVLAGHMVILPATPSAKPIAEVIAGDVAGATILMTPWHTPPAIKPDRGA